MLIAHCHQGGACEGGEIMHNNAWNIFSIHLSCCLSCWHWEFITWKCCLDYLFLDASSAPRHEQQSTIYFSWCEWLDNDDIPVLKEKKLCSEQPWWRKCHITEWKQILRNIFLPVSSQKCHLCSTVWLHGKVLLIFDCHGKTASALKFAVTGMQRHYTCTMQSCLWNCFWWYCTLFHFIFLEFVSIICWQVWFHLPRLQDDDGCSDSVWKR